MRLVLWDVDGTLLRSSRAVAEAYERAIRDVYRLEGELASIPPSGMTDGQIVLERLALHGHAEPDVLALYDAFREAYVAGLESARSRLATELEVLPGVPEILGRLQDRGLYQSLLTGNFEAAARLKLGCVGLDRYVDFALGAFGSDHRDRTCLVPIAIDKVRRIRGVELSSEEVVVVGDTPRDIACARAGGARAVAVATGDHPSTELAHHEPDALLESLHDTDAVVAAVLGA